MVESAARRSASRGALRYCCEDFLEKEYAENSFDCVTSAATLHHLPLRESLEKMKRILKPGGRLLLLDLYRAGTIGDYFLGAVGVLANLVMKVIRKERKSKELREAWAEHGPLDHYPSIREIRRACRETLPQARIRRHIYFRYSLVWDKRQAGEPAPTVPCFEGSYSSMAPPTRRRCLRNE